METKMHSNIHHFLEQFYKEMFYFVIDRNRNKTHKDINKSNMLYH